MRKNRALVVAGTIFFIVAILHALRIFYQIQIVAGSTVIPFWLSYLGTAVFAVLAIWMFSARKG